jgi:hypothetical protein
VISFAALREQAWRPVAPRVQREGESLQQVAALLQRAGRQRHADWPKHLVVIESARSQPERALARP